MSLATCTSLICYVLGSWNPSVRRSTQEFRSTCLTLLVDVVLPSGLQLELSFFGAHLLLAAYILMGARGCSEMGVKGTHFRCAVSIAGVRASTDKADLT